MEALENCENGPETAKEKGCTLDCPLLQIAGATPHPEFFGILRCEERTDSEVDFSPAAAI